MNCREFQKIIPQVLNNKIPYEQLADVTEHLDECKDCYEETEIYYVLQYGLNDNENKKSMNFVGQLDGKIAEMKKKARNYELAKSSYNLIYILANTAVAGAAVYTLFNFL